MDRRVVYYAGRTIFTAKIIFKRFRGIYYGYDTTKNIPASLEHLLYRR